MFNSVINSAPLISDSTGDSQVHQSGCFGIAEARRRGSAGTAVRILGAEPGRHFQPVGACELLSLQSDHLVGDYSGASQFRLAEPRKQTRFLQTTGRGFRQDRNVYARRRKRPHASARQIGGVRGKLELPCLSSFRNYIRLRESEFGNDSPPDTLS